MAEALGSLDFLPPLRLQVNNRKLIEGFYRGLGAPDLAAVMRGCRQAGQGAGRGRRRPVAQPRPGCPPTRPSSAWRWPPSAAATRPSSTRWRRSVSQHPLLDEGLDELAAVIDGCGAIRGVRVEADLRIARGLDYYTGTVFETRMDGFESLGSICSGGRYDSLASDGRTTYPGVGISLGVTRLLMPLVQRGVLSGSRPVPSAVLVALPAETDRARCDEIAQQLRARGISTEVAAAAQKYGKQIRYAERRGIPFVWFPGPSGAAGGEVKDIRSGAQVPADTSSWCPPADDLHPQVISTTRRKLKSHVIRTHDAGTLRASARRPDRDARRVGRHPPRPRRGDLHRPARSPPAPCRWCCARTDVAHDLRNEWVVAVTGEVRLRPEGNVNPAIPTGEIEVVASSLQVLNEAAPLPFQVDEHTEVGEEARLKYRYLDLRRPGPAAALRLRSQVNRAARETLYERGFVEIETPTMTRSTPEGARDFVVPARLRPVRGTPCPSRRSCSSSC